MAEDNKRLLILGSKSGGATTWGSITGTLSDQTDLQNALNTKADSSSVPTSTSDLTNDSGFRTVIEVTDMTQAELLDFYTNYATLMEQNTYVVDGHEAVATTMQIQPYGTVLILESNVRYMTELVGAPTGTIDATGTATYIFADGSKQTDNLTFNFPATEGLATVAMSGSYNDLTNTPTIPTVNDSTITLEDSEGTTIDTFTLNQSSNKTITIPSGGSNAWYGTVEQLEAIPQAELDPDCDYFVTDRIDYSEITNTPTIPTSVGQLSNDMHYSTRSEVYNEVRAAVDYLEAKDVWLTQAEYDALSLAGKLNEDTNYHIENNVDALQMVVTFTDQTTATYNVYIQPSN